MQRLLMRLVLSVLTLAVPGISTAADGNAKAKALYSNTCIACHGANGKGAIPGVPDLGPRMTMTDDDLTNSILNGLQSKGSLMAMPAKGGNPAITAADAAALVVYLRTDLLKNAVQAPGSATTPPITVLEPTTVTLPAAAQASTRVVKPSSDLTAFTRGAKAWGGHCANCHAMRDPKDFNDAQWKVITMHMRLRAGLDGADVRDITTFLTGSN